MNEDVSHPDTGKYHVFRGGSWNVDSEVVRYAFRGGHAPSSKGNVVGIRVARSH